MILDPFGNIQEKEMKLWFELNKLWEELKGSKVYTRRGDSALTHVMRTTKGKAMVIGSIMIFSVLISAIAMPDFEQMEKKRIEFEEQTRREELDKARQLKKS